MPPTNDTAYRSALLRRIRDYLAARQLDREGRELLAAVDAETPGPRRGPRQLVTREQAAAAVAQHGSQKAAAAALGVHANTINKALRRPE